MNYANNTRAMLDKLADLDLVTFRDRATRIWVLRDRAAGVDLAHENTRRDIFTVARAEIARRAA